MYPQTRTSINQKSVVGSPTTNKLKTLIPTLEEEDSKINRSTSTKESGDTSIITKYISMGQKLLNQVKKILGKKAKKMMKMKKGITRTLANLKVIQ